MFNMTYETLKDIRNTILSAAAQSFIYGFATTRDSTGEPFWSKEFCAHEVWRIFAGATWANNMAGPQINRDMRALEIADLTTLTEAQCIDLGFRPWDADGAFGDHFYLIPIWIFPFLSKDDGNRDEFFSIIAVDGELRRTLVKDMDGDQRGGCVAYGFYPSDVEKPMAVVKQQQAEYAKIVDALTSIRLSIDADLIDLKRAAEDPVVSEKNREAVMDLTNRLRQFVNRATDEMLEGWVKTGRIGTPEEIAAYHDRPREAALGEEDGSVVPAMYGGLAV